MYDMYPDTWGPRAATSPRTRAATRPLQASLDLRDNGGQRPDDN